MITINKNCIDLIKSFEGLSLKAYHGAADKIGIDTIGYGTIRYPPNHLNGKHVTIGDPDITNQDAEDFLNHEITEKTKAIDPLLRDDLTPNQYAALMSFAFNLGDGALKQSTLRLKVNKNPNDTSIKDEFLKWVHSNGKKVSGLVRRREAEAKLYFTN